MRTLLLGTRNTGKVIEITSILADSGWSFSSLQEFPNVGEAEENFVTFAENAIAKAQFYASATGLCALADDSGLEVAALGGAPGVFSARYAGANASDADRRALLFFELAKTGDTNRRARFVAVVAVATAGRRSPQRLRRHLRGNNNVRAPRHRRLWLRPTLRSRRLRSNLRRTPRHHQKPHQPPRPRPNQHQSFSGILQILLNLVNPVSA